MTFAPDGIREMRERWHDLLRGWAVGRTHADQRFDEVCRLYAGPGRLIAQVTALFKMLQPRSEIGALYLVRRKIGNPMLLAAHPEVDKSVAMSPSGFVGVFAAILLDPGEKQFDQIARSQPLPLVVLLVLR